jgi:hypothetical protein
MIDNECWISRVNCTNDFLWIKGYKRCGCVFISSKGNNAYLSTICEHKSLGKAIKIALSKRVFIQHPTKETHKFLVEEDKIDEYEQFQYLKKTYGYKKENDICKNMISCSVDLNNEEKLEITPFKRKKNQIWVGVGKETCIYLKSNISLDLLGAAARFAFTRCQGNGRDLVVKALFPDGEPNSLEEYLASVNPDYQKWLISG